ncbi:Alpha/beta hydrolase fold-1 [Dillenia turbinata]|uniref:Alpha/beta hydrolase fold-1 n=1 Tax=Dillenia turbinata TaxID=194707 RepID=A0AAN8ZI11_9MAGN
MDVVVVDSSSKDAYSLLLKAVSLIPISHYLLGFLIIFLVFLYNSLEFHILQDFLTGFRGQPVNLIFNSASDIYHGVASKCRLLHGRYLVTPWLASPHIQTTFLHFFGRAPPVTYTSVLLNIDLLIVIYWIAVSRDAFHGYTGISKDDTTRLWCKPNSPQTVIQSFRPDENSSCVTQSTSKGRRSKQEVHLRYIKHLAFKISKHGWHVVVSNHRGLGGVSITSDCFYNAGWTEDVREVINYLHQQYMAPLFVVGPSIGANVLVKYLGEEGDNTPVAGAAAICSPWDLLIGDRFISRKLLQKLYDRALTVGLQGYAQLHQPLYSRLANWEGIEKSRSIRDFDNHATRHVGKFETVDTYYRQCSSASYVGRVSVPLLCISALDDPVCTREAIPWDECRTNKNVILVTTQHGGHLGYFEGITASTMWWVRATHEFLHILYSSPYMHKKKKVQVHYPLSQASLIDQGPFLNVAEDGMVAAVRKEQTAKVSSDDTSLPQENDRTDTMRPILEQNKHMKESNSLPSMNGAQTSKQAHTNEGIKPPVSVIRRCLDQLLSRKSPWLLTYIAVATWPLLGSALFYFYKKRKMLPAKR